jgi:hypothetical protein
MANDKLMSPVSIQSHPVLCAFPQILLKIKRHQGKLIYPWCVMSLSRAQHCEPIVFALVMRVVTPMKLIPYFFISILNLPFSKTVAMLA